MKEKAWRVLLIESGFLIMTVAAVSLFYRQNSFLLMLMAAGWVVAIKFFHTKEDLVLLLSGAVIGAVAEILSVRTGAWSYANPTMLGVPVWLPLLWGGSLLFMKKFSQTILKVLR